MRFHRLQAPNTRKKRHSRRDGPVFVSAGEVEVVDFLGRTGAERSGSAQVEVIEKLKPLEEDPEFDPEA